MAPERSLRARALQLGTRIPWPFWQPLAVVAAAAASVGPPKAVRQWQLNATTLTGRRPSRNQTRRAIVSWARNWVESMQLTQWGPGRTQASVLIHPDDYALLTGTAASPGAVLALPHSGSWDLAGLWACLNGMPVSSVAEELEGGGEFQLFLDLREALGMRIHSHRDPRALPKLIREARQGRTVCLLADRDFSRRGVPVVWPTGTGPITATMPPGPAEVALRSGGVLLPVISAYEGSRMRLRVPGPIHPDPALEHRAQVADMTQRLCEVFAEHLRARPQDWHMMQPFFPGVEA